MALKKYKPIINGRRNMITLDFAEITKTIPEEPLLQPLPKRARRNNRGKLTARHHGGGYRCRYHVTDFRHNKNGTIAKVDSIQYDPNRSANITLLTYADDEKRYIITPKGLQVGQTIESGVEADIKVSNVLSLQNIPVGAVTHNVELRPGKGGQPARSAGVSSQALSKESKYMLIRLRSDEVRMTLSICRATTGQVGNLRHELVGAGKAGRSRWKGVRPTVHGSVTNPNDYLHGGGEGHVSIGRPSPMSPWGKPTLNKKTRHDRKSSNKLIVRERKKK